MNKQIMHFEIFEFLTLMCLYMLNEIHKGYILYPFYLFYPKIEG